MTDTEQNLLAAYRKLHDWLSDIAEDAERNRRAFPMGQLIVRLTALARLDNLATQDG